VSTWACIYSCGLRDLLQFSLICVVLLHIIGVMVFAGCVAYTMHHALQHTPPTGSASSACSAPHTHAQGFLSRHSSALSALSWLRPAHRVVHTACILWYVVAVTMARQQQLQEHPRSTPVLGAGTFMLCKMPNGLRVTPLLSL
jgi:hypothetical protein